MKSLKATQQDFLRAIYQQDESALAESLTDTDIPASERINVYRNTTMIALRNCLKDAFSKCCALVDERFFMYAASEFIKQHPSTSGNLDEYGADFPAFLARFEPCQHLGYLPDLARVEWAEHIAYFAADSKIFDRQKLASIAAEEYRNLRFTLHPSTQLIHSPYAIDLLFDIDENSDEEINIEAYEAHLVIARPARQVMTYRTQAAHFYFLKKLKENKTLEESFEKALEYDKDFNFATTLDQSIEAGILIDCH